MNKICTVDFCDRPTREGRKWCPGHKEQIQKGQLVRPVNPQKKKTDDPVEWFWKFVDKSEDCWVWTRRAKHRDGYGVYTGRGKTEHAHRVSYEISTGLEIPDGMEVDHICRNPPCVRPEHLRVATRKENAQNLSLASNSTTGVRGVTRTKNGKFQAQVQNDNKYKYLGTYEKLEEAAEAATRYREQVFPFYLREEEDE